MMLAIVAALFLSLCVLPVYAGGASEPTAIMSLVKTSGPGQLMQTKAGYVAFAGATIKASAKMVNTSAPDTPAVTLKKLAAQPYDNAIAEPTVSNDSIRFALPGQYLVYAMAMVFNGDKLVYHQPVEINLTILAPGPYLEVSATQSMTSPTDFVYIKVTNRGTMTASTPTAAASYAGGNVIGLNANCPGNRNASSNCVIVAPFAKPIYVEGSNYTRPISSTYWIWHYAGPFSGRVAINDLAPGQAYLIRFALKNEVATSQLNVTLVRKGTGFEAVVTNPIAGTVAKDVVVKLYASASHLAITAVDTNEVMGYSAIAVKNPIVVNAWIGRDLGNGYSYSSANVSTEIVDGSTITSMAIGSVFAGQPVKIAGELDYTAELAGEIRLYSEYNDSDKIQLYQMYDGAYGSWVSAGQKAHVVAIAFGITDPAARIHMSGPGVIGQVILPRMDCYLDPGDYLFWVEKDGKRTKEVLLHVYGSDDRG
jgi:hypothetical protein